MPSSFTPASRKLAQELVLELSKRGMTQTEIAEMCGPGTDQSAISRAKKGSGVQPSSLLKLAEILGRKDAAIAALADKSDVDSDRVPDALRAAMQRDPKSRVGIAAAKAFADRVRLRVPGVDRLLASAQRQRTKSERHAPSSRRLTSHLRVAQRFYARLHKKRHSGLAPR